MIKSKISPMLMISRQLIVPIKSRKILSMMRVNIRLQEIQDYHKFLVVLSLNIEKSLLKKQWKKLIIHRLIHKNKFLIMDLSQIYLKSKWIDLSKKFAIKYAWVILMVNLHQNPQRNLITTITHQSQFVREQRIWFYIKAIQWSIIIQV